MSKTLKSVFPPTYLMSLFSNAPGPVEEVLNYLKKEGIIGGYALESYYPDLKNCMLICVTELNSRKEMDILIEKLQAL